MNRYEKELRKEIWDLYYAIREAEGEERERMLETKVRRIHDLLNFDPHLRTIYRRNQDPTGVIGNVELA